jgi:hypothetical protein
MTIDGRRVGDAKSPMPNDDFIPNRLPTIYLFVFRAACRKPESYDGGEVGLRISVS